MFWPFRRGPSWSQWVIQWCDGLNFNPPYGNDAEADLNRKNGDKIDLKVEIKWRKHYSKKRATLDLSKHYASFKMAHRLTEAAYGAI